jgi:hypothetical protein
VQDTARLRFRLPSAGRVTVQVRNAAGTVIRRDALGRLRSGAHVWRWNARGLPDGRYIVGIAVRRGTSGGVRRGWAGASGTVDTRRPGLAPPSAARRSIYPVPDGFRDSLRIDSRAGEPGRLILSVRAADGRLVARRTRRVGTGPVHLVWHGRDRRGGITPGGDYRWRLQLRDRAGNETTSRSFRLRVSDRKLVSERLALPEAAATASLGRTNPRCTAAGTAGSAYLHGVLLTNSCAADSFDFSFARFGFRLPLARSYRRIAVVVRGRALRRPAELSASVERTDDQVEHQHAVTLRRGSARSVRVIAVPARHHVTAQRQVFATVLLDSRYRGTNAVDLRGVTLRVTALVLH